MDKVHKELYDAKEELEKLREECRVQRELCVSLRRSHNDQLVKLQGAKLQIEKQAHELNVKAEEVAEATRLYEEVKSRVQEAESNLKHAILASEALRRDCSEKVEKVETENKRLVSALDEATNRVLDLEGKVCSCDKEVEVLKGLLSDSQRKVIEAEQKAEALRELRQKDDIIGRLEEQSMNFQDQLKWKKEQFEHLEEAHKRLQSQFQSSKEEWENEKSCLLEEVSFFQTSLDTQSRKSESLETQLRICNQALAHEESRRKALELQLSESKVCYENVVAECQQVKSKVENLMAKRDEEVASLRSSLGMKDTSLKEMEYRTGHLEQENQELLQSVKDLQEALISKRKADPLIPKLKNKLKDLEQLHNACPLILKEKEREWNSKLDSAIKLVDGYKFDLKSQRDQLYQLERQVEVFHSSLEVYDEEISILLMVLKSEYTEACFQLLCSDHQIALCSTNREEKITFPAEHLEMMEDCAPVNPQIHLQQALEEMTSLAQKLESFRSLEDRAAALENELEKNRKKLEESSICQFELREQVKLMEETLINVSSALDKSNSELTVTICKANQAEYELQTWKSTTEGMTTRVEQYQEICRQLETSLLCQVETEECVRQENERLLHKLEDQSEELSRLWQQVALLNKKLKDEEEGKEDEHSQLTESVLHLQKQVASLERELQKREGAATKLARMEADKIFQLEKEKLQMIAKGKDQQLEDLQALVSSLEQHLVNAWILSFSETVEKLVKINALEEALGQAQYLMNLESSKKNRMIGELENEVDSLKTRLIIQEVSLFHSEQTASEYHALVENQQLEMENLKETFEKKQAKLKKMVRELEFSRVALLENINALSLERQNLLVYVGEISDKVGEFCEGDMKLMVALTQLSRNPGDEVDLTLDALKSENFQDPTRESETVASLINEVKRSSDGRFPLKELNG